MKLILCFVEYGFTDACEETCVLISGPEGSYCRISDDSMSTSSIWNNNAAYGAVASRLGGAGWYANHVQESAWQEGAIWIQVSS